MKIYSDINIRPASSPSDYIDELKLIATRPWVFEKTASDDYTSGIGGTGLVFSLEDHHKLPDSKLFLCETDEGTLHVGNIVPSDAYLEPDDYNEILRDFASSVLGNHSQSASSTVEIGADQLLLQVLLQDDTYRKLRLFSSNANRNALHPYDWERFFDFVISLHKSGAKLYDDVLYRWFVEHENWSEEQAGAMLTPFNATIGVLGRYDQR